MSRIDDLKRQNPQLNVNLIDLIAEADPSGTYKYLGFLIKMLKENSSNNNMNILRHLFGEENILALSKFEEHSIANRIKVKDIGLYNSFKQIKDEVAEADEIVRTKEMEKQAKVIYKDDEWLVLIPLSYEASHLYGRNTKWCTTQEKYWTQYKSEYKLIYIINKKNDNVKYAISSKTSHDLVQGWRPDDSEINPFMIPIPSQILSVVIMEIRDKESIDEMDEYIKINGRSTQLYQSELSDLRTYQTPPYFSGSTYHNDLVEYAFDADSFMGDFIQNREMDISDILDTNRIAQIINKLKIRQ